MSAFMSILGRFTIRAILDELSSFTNQSHRHQVHGLISNSVGNEFSKRFECQEVLELPKICISSLFKLDHLLELEPATLIVDPYHPLSGTLEQLDWSLVGKIQVVAVDRLWEHIPIVGLMVVENKRYGERSELVKRDIEIATVDVECVMRLISGQVVDQFNIRNKFATIHQEECLGNLVVNLNTAQWNLVNVSISLELTE
ncbi:hypothetical protein Tco_1164274 [Tanacetum coccineum]